MEKRNDVTKQIKIKWQQNHAGMSIQFHCDLELGAISQFSFPPKNDVCFDGWMTCNFTSFLTVFQSYQDDVWMIMKGCVQWISVYGREDFTSSEALTQSAKSVGQRLTH